MSVVTETTARPNLLVLTSTYPRWPGDPEPGFVHELSKRLIDKFNVIVLGPHAPGALPCEAMEGVEVIRYRYAPQRFETLVNDGGIVTNLRKHFWKFALLPTFLSLQAWHAWRLIRSRDIRVIHAHWIVPQGLIGALFHFLPGKSAPFLVTSHGADLFALKGSLFDRVKRFVLRRASAVTVVSEGMRDEVERLGARVARVAVEPMGVDLQERFIPAAGNPRSRNELLFVGRMVEKKGLKYLLDAMPLILAVRRDATLTIVGFGPEEEERRQQAQDLGILDRVSFLGAMDQASLPELYQRAAVFVAPFVQAASGDQEGLGLVLVEALACQCPVVVSDLPATRDVAIASSGVLRVVPGDSVALASGIVRMLETPPVCDRQSVESFDWPLRAAAYAKILESLAKEDADHGEH